MPLAPSSAVSDTPRFRLHHEGSAALALALLIGAFAAPPALAQELRQPRGVTVNQPRADSLTRGDVHAYGLDVPAGSFVYGEVEQQTVDVVITVFAPDGAWLGAFDEPARGPEPFRFTAATAGRYRIEVTPFEQEQGRYTLTVRRVEPLETTSAGRVRQLMAGYDRADGPGATILVMRQGRTVHSASFGMASLEHGIPISSQSVFDVASLAKQVTGLAIAMLHVQGRLSLDADVRSFLPDMPDYGTPITVRQLVHHTSGIRDWANSVPLAGLRFEDVIAFDYILDLARRQRELNFAPGSEYLYSNTGYNLLARIVEVATGQSFASWTREHIFEPLGMTATHFRETHDDVVPRRVQAYRVGSDGSLRAVANNLSAAGSSSLFTSAEDLGRWVTNFGRQTVGGAAAHALFREAGRLNDGRSSGYAFGIAVGDFRGRPRLSHTGSWAGFGTAIQYYPDLDVGVIVLGNVAGFPAAQTATEVMMTFFGDELGPASGPPAQSGSAADSGARWSPSADELRAYAGRFHSHEMDATLHVELRDGSLVVSHPRVGSATLSPRTRDMFTGDQWYASAVRFERDAAGGVTAMRITNGRVRNVRYDRVRAE